MIAASATFPLLFAPRFVPNYQGEAIRHVGSQLPITYH